MATNTFQPNVVELQPSHPCTISNLNWISMHLGPESIPNLHFNCYNKGSYSTPLCNILVNLRELSVNEEG